MAEIGTQGSFWPDIRPPRPVPARIREIGRRRKGRPGLLPAHRDIPRFIDLVLASGSPSRVEVLRLLGLHFRVHPADIDETAAPSQQPRDLVLDLSRRKACAVARHYPQALVIGADSIIWHAGAVLGKPSGIDHARQMLAAMSGSTHEVVTGVTIVDCMRQSSLSCAVATAVTFRSLSPQAIERYIATGEPFGRAGAYALQGTGALLVAHIDGEYSNVYGLPISSFVNMLDELGYELL